jgi:hypothetical protein
MVKYTEQHHFFEIVKESKLYWFVKCYKKREVFTMNYNKVLLSYDNFETYFEFSNELKDDITKILKSKYDIHDIEIEITDVYKCNYKNVDILPKNSILLHSTKRAIYTSIYKMIFNLAWSKSINASQRHKNINKEDFKEHKTHLKKIRKITKMKKKEFRSFICDAICHFNRENPLREDLDIAINKLMLKLKIDFKTDLKIV